MTDQVERAARGDQDIPIIMGIHEGRVTVSFPLKVNHLKLSVEKALAFAEGLAEDVKLSVEIVATPVTTLETEQGVVELAQAGFKVGTLPDRRVVIDFGRELDFLKFSDEQALGLAQGLVEAARRAAAGQHVITGTNLNPDRTR